MFIVGDIHGKHFAYKKIVENLPGPSVQIGDLGYGFNDHDTKKFEEIFEASSDHRWIRGNHDNPHEMKNSVGWIEDGVIEDDIMFIGGAHSPDHIHRKEGFDWWPEEELEYWQFLELLDVYKEKKPKVMITHDLPFGIPQQLHPSLSFASGFKYNKTSSAFETFFEEHQPDVWVAGHWHHTCSETINGTKFQIVGINEVVDLERL